MSNEWDDLIASLQNKKLSDGDKSAKVSAVLRPRLQAASSEFADLGRELATALSRAGVQQIAKRWVSDRRPVRYDGVWYIDVETAGENPWNVFLDENGVWYLGWQAQQPISLPFTFVSENHLHTMLDDEGHLEPREVAVQMTNGDSIGLVFFDDKLVTSYGGVPLKDAIRNGVERMFRA